MSGPCMILIERKYFNFSIWHLSFLTVPYSSFWKFETLESLHDWLSSNWNRWTILERAWNIALVLQIVQKIPEKYCPCLYLSIDQVWWVNELWFKRYIQKSFLSHILIAHYEVTDLVGHRMFKNTKTWISREQNITFLRNKKILSLCLIW